MDYSAVAGCIPSTTRCVFHFVDTSLSFQACAHQCSPALPTVPFSPDEHLFEWRLLLKLPICGLHFLHATFPVSATPKAAFLLDDVPPVLESLTPPRLPSLPTVSHLTPYFTAELRLISPSPLNSALSTVGARLITHN